MNKEIATLRRGDTWPPEGLRSLEQFEEERDLVLRATKELLSDFCRKHFRHFRGDKRVLEVGSGTGFLRRTWPEKFPGKWIELDSQLVFLENARERKPEDSYVGGSIYSLPFLDGSFDVVCGLGSYDIFGDLATAIKESHRILKEGGLFFHLLDLIPSTEYERVEERIGQEMRMEGWEELLRQSVASWEKCARGITTQDIQKIQNIFEKNLTRALASCFNSETVEIETLISEYRGKRTEQQRKDYPGFFVFTNNAGELVQYENSMIYLMQMQKRLSLLQLICAVPSFCRQLFERELSKLCSSLVQKIESPVTEISTVRVIIARKGVVNPK